MTKVSVIIPNFNAESVVAQTLDSLLAQTYPNWEALIVDDCSTDNSVEIINSYAQKDRRIRLIQCTTNNGGPAVPRNIGIAAAKGEYIAFLDSDDIWLPEKLEIQLDFLNKTGYSLCCTAYEIIDSEGLSQNKVVIPPATLSYQSYLRNTAIGFSTSLVERNVLNGITFKPLPLAEDVAFWLEILRNGHTMVGLPSVLAQYRVQRHSLSSNKFRSARQIWRIYRHIEGFNTIRSLYYFSGYAYNAVKKRL